ASGTSVSTGLRRFARKDDLFLIGSRSRPAARWSMSGLVQKIDEAIADHRAGRIAEAERKYREILAAEPTERKALQFLALIALQRRQPQLALDLMRNAIARDGRVAEFHNRLGEAHLALASRRGRAVLRQGPAAPALL